MGLSVVGLNTQAVPIMMNHRPQQLLDGLRKVEVPMVTLNGKTIIPFTGPSSTLAHSTTQANLKMVNLLPMAARGASLMQPNPTFSSTNTPKCWFRV